MDNRVEGLLTQDEPQKKERVMVSRNVKKSIRLILVACLSMFILYLDHITGPRIQFPILHVFPVVLASLWGGMIWGLGYSFVLPVARFTLLLVDSTARLDIMAFNTSLFILVLGLIAYLTPFVTHAKELTEEVDRYRRLLPICGFCKRIRTEKQSWIQLEQYLYAHADLDFSHGVCPECAERHYGVEASGAVGPDTFPES